MRRFSLIAGSGFGLVGVILGAFGAHALKETLLARGMAGVWETAVHFQLFHATALVAVAALGGSVPAAVSARLRCAARLWTIGLVLFSGSLYLLAVGGPRWLGPITPFGGLSLIVGWSFALAAGLALKE